MASTRTRTVNVKDISRPAETLSPVDLQQLVPLPPPYDTPEPAAMWKDLTPERRAAVDAPWTASRRSA